MLTPTQLTALNALPTPLLVDARARLGLPESHTDPGIRPLIPFTKMVGVAVTVKLEIAKDKDHASLTPMRDAYESQKLGANAIIVIEIPPAFGRYGIVGGCAAIMGRRNGFVGALIEGGIRDTHELRDVNFPAFSRTITNGFIIGHANTASIFKPVTIGGQSVHNGDIIAADNDGVVIIRPADLDAVIARARAIVAWEERVHGGLAAGKPHKQVIDEAGPMP